MATVEIHGGALDITERLAILADLLVSNPASAVGLCAPGGNTGDAGQVLAKVGIPVAGHGVLQASALVEFLAPSDAGSIGDASREVGVRGHATRTVRLRDGQWADLHLIEIDDAERAMVAVIVPGAGASIVGTAKPTAMEATSRIGVLLADPFGLITSASDSISLLLGGPSAPIVGTSVIDLLHFDDREMAVVNWLAAKAHRGVALRWRFRLLRADGSSLWTETTITNEVGTDGTGVVRFELYDISTEVAATEALVAERELIGLLTETLPVGVAKFDTLGRVEHANGRLSELLAPLDPHEVLAAAVRGDVDDVELAAAFNALMRDGAASRLVVDHIDAYGKMRHLEWTIRAAHGGGAITGGVVCIADVSESVQLREVLEGRASTDALTGCLNRAGTVAALELALSNVARTGGIGVLFIDLDDFKNINDTRGHAVGDAVLEVVASRLRGALRGSDDVLGRLGGDEFVVISAGLRSADATLAFACRVSEHIEGPATVAGFVVPIGASIGVAWTTTSTAGDLLAAADAAMYVAKQTRSETPILSYRSLG